MAQILSYQLASSGVEARRPAPTNMVSAQPLLTMPKKGVQVAGARVQFPRKRVVALAGTDYGLGLAAVGTAKETMPKKGKAKVPLKLEEGELPLNTFKPKEPFVGKVLSVERIVGPNATGETCHIRISHDSKMPFWEGQSYGVIPPGKKLNKKGKEVNHNVRLYSIASTRYGDNFKGNETTLCVRRATYWDPEKGAEDPEKKGICSNFLCDAKPGDKVTLTGPTGTAMLLPTDPNAVHIMVATGTGIAPFRAYLRRMFVENLPDYDFTGLAWLFMGVANSDAKLYDDEFQEMLSSNPDQFRLDYALSREQKNKSGGKMYIQDKMEEYADQVFDLLDNGAHIYFCGLKGMMPGIQDMLKKVCESKGMDFDAWLKNLKEEKRFHVEVY